MMKNLLCNALLLFAAISLASATEIVIDTAHHHLGDDYNYDDFEFYDLAMHLTETEPVTLEPPLRVAWTYELSRPFSAPPLPVSLIAENVVYLENDISIKAIDADTGELLWNKGWSANLAYKDGVLFAVRYANIDALDAKTGTLLWRKEYLRRDGNGPPLPIGVPGGNPVIFGDTLYVSTYSGKYVFAIDTGDGNLKWRYELNITEFGAGGRNSYSLSIPAVSEDILVFQYYAHHSSYTGPPVAIEPGEPAPEPGETITKMGLIALNTKTGEEVWEYAYAGEVPFLKPFIYKDLVYISLGGGNVIALSIESGEEVWKEKVGDWAVIVAVEDGKLFVDSKKAVILDADTGEILKEYPDSKLQFSSSEITDKYIFTATSGKDKIRVFDINTGELVWKGGRTKGYGVSKPTLYKDKLYLTSNDGILYAFEHGAEQFAIETIHIYLATLAILFLLIGAIAYKKRFSLKNTYLEGKLQKSFKFSVIIALIISAFGLFFNCLPIPGPAHLTFANIAFGLIFSALNPIMLLLLSTSIIWGISIIMGTLIGLRTKNKVLIGVAIGATPHIIVALSLLYVSIVEEYFHGMVQEGIALGLAIGFVGSLIAAVIAGIMGGVLGVCITERLNGKKK